ncbi:MAG TPA: HAMP domain-containing sensor histidine kinase [Candidatus Limnocylindria bacterium]|nr:HAMP domain-containing sensor histidine kinase [Candidatus Limnocylindria bacterium]
MATALYRSIGQAAAALTFVPVALTGAFFGARAGTLAGVAVALIDAVTMEWQGVLGDGVFGIGQVAAGSVGFAILGFISGRMRELGLRVRAQAADLERELQQRREYADVLVHELRNPLVAIRAAARTGDRDVERLSRTLDLIGQEAARAIGMIDSLTDASSIESGRMRSVLRPMDIVAVVRRAAERNADAEHPLNIELPGRPIGVRGDEDRIDQVVSNLMSNAAKYAPPGTPIDVAVGVSADRACAVVQVRDYGPGIPPPERERLFGRFSRLSTAGATPGSGLGLYISRSIVRDHQGDLYAEWPSGGGTQFGFTIPLAER